MSSLVSLLALHLRTHGPIKTARVSSAQANCPYSYWGAVRYHIRLTVAGVPSNVALERASSDRRSVAGAERDCEAMCEREGRIRLDRIGPVSEQDAARLLAEIGGYDSAIALHHARRVKPATSLTLRQRLLAWLAARVGVKDAAVKVANGKVSRDGRWIVEAAPSYIGMGCCTRHYLPWGDNRDVAAFVGESNQESRRRIYAACGDRVVTDDSRRLVQQDDYGSLYELWDRSRVVRVVCPSTAAVYWLPCSYRARTARDAVAGTFGLAGSDYAPLVEA